MQAQNRDKESGKAARAPARQPTQQRAMMAVPAAEKTARLQAVALLARRAEPPGEAARVAVQEVESALRRHAKQALGPSGPQVLQKEERGEQRTRMAEGAAKAAQVKYRTALIAAKQPAPGRRSERS